MPELDGDPQGIEQGGGTRYSRDAVLLALQAPTSGAPRSSRLDAITDPVLPPRTAQDRLAHFFPGLYDTRPESHLARLLKVVLGDSGAGQLRKRYLVARMGSVVLTTRFGDMDRLYGAIFGFNRLSGEQLDISPYYDAATAEEWAEIDARDARYRSRVEQFSRALPLTGTPMGIAAVAQALLSVECQVYETWTLVDENGGNPGGAPPPVGGRTYGEVEAAFAAYGDMEDGTYADVEGGTGSFGRTTAQNRSEVVVRPLRQITLEEAYQLSRVLARLKPAFALLTVNAEGVTVHSPIRIRDVAADSTHWEVAVKVQPTQTMAPYYPRPVTTAPTAQPRPAFSGYQGEAWSYNSDVTTVTAYVESDTGALVSDVDYERITGSDGKPLDLTPDRALADPDAIMRGRAASDAVLQAAPYASVRAGVSLP